MTTQVLLACQDEVMEIALARILPMRLLDDSIRKTSKYECIAASLRELGLIEPLVVFPQPRTDGCFMLLDGHVRLMILKELAHASAKCLISTDDEAYTYNHKVSRLSAIQEHFMILRAIKMGIDEERIARCLNVNVYSIRQKRDLLDGICAEAVQLLKDKRATGDAIRELRKVKPLRQIEIAELMGAASNVSLGYAKCLVAATPADQLADAERAPLHPGAEGLALEHLHDDEGAPVGKSADVEDVDDPRIMDARRRLGQGGIQGGLDLGAFQRCQKAATEGKGHQLGGRQAQRGDVVKAVQQPPPDFSLDPFRDQRNMCGFESGQVAADGGSHRLVHHHPRGEEQAVALKPVAGAGAPPEYENDDSVSRIKRRSRRLIFCPATRYAAVASVMYPRPPA